MLKKSFLFFAILFTLTITSCVTTEYVYIEPEPPILPEIPEGVVLTESSPINEYLLMVNDIKWLKWSLFVKKAVGLIDEETYKKKIDECNQTIEGFDEAFRNYQDSLLD